jgi:hypothetical protein
VFTKASGAVLSVLCAGSTGSSRQSVFDKLNHRWLDQVRADVECPYNKAGFEEFFFWFSTRLASTKFFSSASAALRSAPKD